MATLEDALCALITAHIELKFNPPSTTRWADFIIQVFDQIWHSLTVNDLSELGVFPLEDLGIIGKDSIMVRVMKNDRNRNEPVYSLVRTSIYVKKTTQPGALYAVDSL